jgi:acylphosphatase
LKRATVGRSSPRDATARSIARNFQITGWVRNEPDGSVALELQGPAHELNAYLNALAERLADYIRTTDTSPIAIEPDEQGFEIRH